MTSQGKQSRLRSLADLGQVQKALAAEQVCQAAELAARTAERMSSTVDDLLRYARNEQAVMTTEPLDLGPLVAEVADEFRSPAATRSLHIELVEATGPVEVEGDRSALRQALANLLDNAVRLAPEGSTISVGAGIDGPWAWAAVTDEGPGIAPEDQTQVFRRFWRGPQAGGRGSDTRLVAGVRFWF